MKFNELEPLVMYSAEAVEFFPLFIEPKRFVAIINLDHRPASWDIISFTKGDWAGSDFEDKSEEAGMAEDLFTNQEIIKMFFEGRWIT